MPTRSWKKKNRKHLLQYLRNYFQKKYTDPDWQEKKIEQNLEYYRRNKEKINRKLRLKYKTDKDWRKRLIQKRREYYRKRRRSLKSS